MAECTTVHQNGGPTARDPDQDSTGNSPDVVGNGAVGTLSRTIVPSTTIRWILPGRVRHPDHNDVIFIGESFVQLREFLPTPHLADIPAWLDLGCRILAAKVISYVDATPFVEQVVKQEERDHDKPKSTRPPQILLLALDSGEIAFVYAEELVPKHVRFRVARKKLPADVSSLGKFGRHLAVDSKSSTLAISPAYGQVGLLRLKAIPELYDEIAAYNEGRVDVFKPLKEERFIPVPGFILRMDFLLPSQTTHAKTVLALLISKHDATHLVLYSWEDNSPLRYAKLESCSPHRLPDADRMPLLMIPSNHNASFTLVTESGLAVYDNVLSSNLRRYPIDISQNLPPKFVGFCRTPLWVQWAKPCRHSEYLKTNDDFFLVREDGAVEYFEIKHSELTKLQFRLHVGSLNMSVDSAFAILGGPPDQGGDICVVGGDMTNGAVYHIKARRPPEKFQTIKNLAPIRDMLVLGTSTDEDANRMFVCSGKGEGHAAIAELRKGLEARLGLFADIGASSTATGLWLLPEIIPDQFTLLVSYPLHTSALHIDVRESTIESADDDLASQGLQLSSQTLVFAVTNESLLIQVTSSAVAILSPSSEKKSLHKKHENYPVLIASINADHLLYATVSMVNDGFQVLLSSIDVDDAGMSVNDWSGAYSMVEEPSSILIFAIGQMRFLTVGTIAGSIHLLAIEPGQGAQFLSEYSIPTLFPHVEKSAISSLACLTDPSLSHPILACGTRNGWLLAMAIAPGVTTVNSQQREATNVIRARLDNLPDAVDLLSKSAQRIGQTTVNLISEPGNPSAALLSCDCQVYHVLYSQPGWFSGFQISRVWFTNVTQPELDQPDVSAVAALYCHGPSGQGHLEATLLCVTRGDVLISSLSLEPSLVPRRMMLAGDPYKMAFSDDLGKLVVAIEHTVLTADAAPRRPVRRVVRPGIQFLNADNSGSSSTRKQVVLVGQAGSRVTAMLSWTPTNGTKHTEVVVIGLYIDGPDTAHCDGRVVYLTLVKNIHNDGELHVDINRSVRFVGAPVYSLVQYGLSSLVICAGTKLFVQRLDFLTGQWIRIAHRSLPSPAMSLDVSGNLIFAATARHSLKIFELVGSELILRAEESRQREAAKFVGTNEVDMVATPGNNGGRLLGVSTQDRGAFPLLFDIGLPHRVNCLRKSYKGRSITKADKTYYGSTLVGAIYQFTVLDRREWKFLDFIVRLLWKRHAPQSHARRKISSTQSQQRNTSCPMGMHINGDYVADLLLGGPREFRRLLEEPEFPVLSQHEPISPDQRLRELSALGEPLFGPSEDPVLAAFLWIQKLLSTT